MGAQHHPYFLPLPRCSPLCPPRLTLAPGPGLPESTEFQYSALLRLPAHCRQIDQISRPMGVMYNALLLMLTCTLWLSVLPLYPFFVLTDLRYISRPTRRYIRPRCRGGYEGRLLQSPSHRACSIKVARVITTITRHRLFIV